MAITRVQGNARGQWAYPGLVYTVVLDSTPTQGNILVLVAGSEASITNYIGSVVQTGVTWTRQVYNMYGMPTPDADILTSEIWVGIVGSGASTTITITITGAGDQNMVGAAADVCEYSGVVTSNFLDKTATAQGQVYSTPNTSTGTTSATTQKEELWIGAIMLNFLNDQTSPTSGFTLLDGLGFGYNSLAYLEKIVSAAGTASSGTTASQGTYNFYNGCIATLYGTSREKALTQTVSVASSVSHIGGTVNYVQISSETVTVALSHVKNISAFHSQPISVATPLSKKSSAFMSQPISVLAQLPLKNTSKLGTQLVTVAPLSTKYSTKTFSQPLIVLGSSVKSPVKSGVQSIAVLDFLQPVSFEKLSSQEVVVMPLPIRTSSFLRSFTQLLKTSLQLTTYISGTLSISRVSTTVNLVGGYAASREYRRTYIEWPITDIPSGVTITSVKLKYHGKTKPTTDTVSIYSMAYQPSAQPDTNVGNQVIYADIEDGTAYVSGSTVFPVVATDQTIDLGSGAVTALQAALTAGTTWFAIGIKTNEVTVGDLAEIYSEDDPSSTPKPTLIVAYTTISAAPHLGTYMVRMAKTRGNYLRQNLVAKVPTNQVQSVSCWGRTDSIAVAAQIEVVVHYDDYYSDTTSITLTTAWTPYYCKFTNGKNIDYIKITYVGTTEAGQYLYFDDFFVDFHELEVKGSVESSISPFQNIDTTITRDANGRISKIVMADSTRTVTLDITRDANGRITAIDKTVS